MRPIMIEIGIYMVFAILLGYFFGWLITKILLKHKYQKANHPNDNELIQELQAKLSSLEERHEKEIDSFMVEHLEITQKYKELLHRD